MNDGWEDQSRFAQRGKVHPNHAISKVRGDVVRKRLGQARLTDPARTSQRQQGNGLLEKQRSCRGNPGLATDERSARDGR